MIAWMLYSTIVGLLAIAAASSMECIARMVGAPVRWIWTACMLLVVLLSLAAPYRGESKQIDAAVVDALPSSTRSPDITPTTSWLDVVRSRASELGERWNSTIQQPLAIASRGVPSSVAPYVTVGWLASSAVMLLLLMSVTHRFHRARQQWPEATIHGIAVRVASHIGPVVVGFIRPVIVVPQWLLARDPNEQRLVVSHEHEHVRARDPWLLAIAWCAIVLTPWNIALWYMLSRLRLAVELDCDARVLRRGVAPRSYGTLLIDVAQRASTMRLSALALADDSSHLHQRILAMKPVAPRLPFVRAGVAGAFTLVALLGACASELPTAAQIDKMDGAAALEHASRLASVSGDSIRYVIDGLTATAERARGIVANKLERVDVRKHAGSPTEVHLTTKKHEGNLIVDSMALHHAKTHASADSHTVRIRVDTDSAHMVAHGQLRRDNTEEASRAMDAAVHKLVPVGEPLIFINGVKATYADVKALNVNAIESVEVLKGAAAARAYADPAAANGVIVIATKKK
jgi:beta-lactamase regulating signal transducer with metallopeptidase domain